MTSSASSSKAVAAWFWATRPFSLTASIVPVLVGTAIAAMVTQVDWLLFALALAGSIFIQIGTNLTDEYADHLRQGSKGTKFLAPHKVIAKGLLSPNAVRNGMVFAFGVGIVCGLYIVSQVGWPILAVGVASVAVAYFYAGGPKSIGSIGLGEVAVFLFMGPIMVGASFYVQAQRLEPAALAASVPVAFLVAAILHCNNLRDIDEDRADGKRSLALLIGQPASRWVYAALLAAAYTGLAAGALWGPLPTWAALGLLTIPLAANTVRLLFQADDRRAMNRIMIRTAQLHAYSGVLLAAGVSLAAAL